MSPPPPDRGPDPVDFPTLYRSLIERYGDDPRAAAWHSRESQHTRFAVIAEYVGPRDSVLDVGCGPAHLAGYLRERAWQGSYLGVDSLPEMAALARARGLTIVTAAAGDAGRPLSQELRRQGIGPVDVVVANGLAAEQQGSERARLSWLARVLGDLSAAATKAVVMTFLSAAHPPAGRLPGRWFAPLGKVTELAAGLGHPLTVRPDYRPDDFTLVVHLPGTLPRRH